MEREFDVVVWGASGFTGELVSAYLVEAYGVGGDLRWAIAGRNPVKLGQVRDRLLPAAQRESLPILVANGEDLPGLSELAARTRVVCSTVGPYAKYGTPMVAACAGTGTNYCDLAGELQWMAQVIPTYQDQARATGACIVHSCGFDSIPCDMGVLFLQQAMLERHGVPAVQVKTRVSRFQGEASGGTLASIMYLMEEASRDSSIRRIIADPYALNPQDSPRGQDGPDQQGAHFDVDFRRWTYPFIMSLVNTRVVRRSNALLDFPWGKDFRYDEMLLASSRWQAVRNAIALKLGMTAMALSPTRALLKRFLPGPGEGPDQKSREAGSYELYLHASHPGGPQGDLRARVAGDMDPGYGSTAKMLGESAVCLARDELKVGGGFWTPASGMGQALLHRLIDNAGLTFELVDFGRE